jgi:hypothetical protein
LAFDDQQNRTITNKIGSPMPTAAKPRSVPLTDAKIRQSKLGVAIKKMSDGGGLHIVLTPSGGRHWKLAYRFGPPERRKQMLLPLGSYPAMGLANARQAVTDARALLAKGNRPRPAAQG